MGPLSGLTGVGAFFNPELPLRATHFEFLRDSGMDFIALNEMKATCV